jgi:hypothetical protein
MNTPSSGALRSNGYRTPNRGVLSVPGRKPLTRFSLMPLRAALRLVDHEGIAAHSAGDWRKPIESTRRLTIAFWRTSRAKPSPSWRANSLYRSFRTPSDVDPLRFHGMVQILNEISSCCVYPCRMPASPQPPDQFEQMLAEMETPEWKLKYQADHRFLREVIYAGLQDLNTGFDSPLVWPFLPGGFPHCDRPM